MCLNFEMSAVIEFNRPINDEKDYISPGGFRMTMDGREVHFDFKNSDGFVDNHNACLYHVRMTNPDYSEFSDLKFFTKDMLEKVEQIDDFFVFTGEKEETDLVPVKLISAHFLVWHEKRWIPIVMKRNVVGNASMHSAVEEHMKDYLNLVLEMANKEYEDFVMGLICQPAADVIAHAYEKTLKEEFLNLLENMDLASEHWKLLYQSKAPLSFLYSEWLKNDLSYHEVLESSICLIFDK